MTFAALFVSEKREKRKVSLCIIAGERCSPLPYRVEVLSTAKRKNQMLHPLFLLHIQAQKKKLSKRKRRGRTFTLCGARQRLRAFECAAF